ncbi:hypothetical protein COO72_11475 [Bifidobacterium callitrichos]|nr:hypothetical protein COO72_11475 [Bifidobacterium callitrichos]
MPFGFPIDLLQIGLLSSPFLSGSLTPVVFCRFQGFWFLTYVPFALFASSSAPVTSKMNLTVPTWMAERLDSEAGHLAVSRNALVNMWLAERIRQEDRERELVH